MLIYVEAISSYIEFQTGGNSWPVRIEGGFELGTGEGQDHYWINWTEPDRDFLLGWHRDDDHPDLSLVLLQVGQGGEPTAYASVTAGDAHPMAVLETRLAQIFDSLSAVPVDEDTVTGVDF